MIIEALIIVKLILGLLNTQKSIAEQEKIQKPRAIMIIAGSMG